MEKVKIVLDADVIIHFSAGGQLFLLSSILPQYDYVVLSHVYDEVKPPVRAELDRVMETFKKMNVVKFEPTGEMRKEYASLIKSYGKGESACMAYCRFTNNVVGSSNLTDIKTYCSTHGITYVSTVDFLYYAVKNKKMTAKEANNFIRELREKGHKLPDVEIETYTPSTTL